MKKVFIKVLLVMVFLLGILGVSPNVYASTDNFDVCNREGNFTKVYEIKSRNGSNITSELVRYLEEAKNIANASNYVMIHIPSGTYNVGDDNNLVLHSYIYIVAENDTKITKTSGSNSILRTRSSENSKNCTIYGGTWDGNNKARQGIEINNATNITVKNATFQNSIENGIYLNNKSTAKVESCTSTRNKKNGLSIYSASTTDLRNSTISHNNEYGICVAEGSILNANDYANNQINYNNWSGISATKSNTKVYLHNNTITYNGQKPKGTGDGAVGHGVGISEKAYASIINNTIQNNKECGISVFDGSKVTISNNTISSNKRHGIGARKNVNLTVSNNNINSNSYNGFLLANKSKATVNGNKIKSNKTFGLSIVDGSQATLSSTEASNNTSCNISISKGSDKKDNAKVILKDNNLISGSKKNHGIVLSGKTSLQITGKNNIISKNKKNGISSTDKKATVKITGKTTFDSNKQSGIYIKASKAEISNVTVSNNSKYGVCVEGKGNLVLSKSTIKSNKNYGVNVAGSGTKAKIEKNTISKNAKTGIMVNSKSSVSSIYKNTIEKNGQIGITIKAGSKVSSIKKNTIKNHSKYGIAIYKCKKPKMTSNKLKNSKAKKETYVQK
ncbi:MAG: right-handed parallel beta-helix repeat-containing protein [Clostridia bacterium]|nr:right-handed parallel beta-helix repeat-containing protein [Clostridia bacterium]